MPIHPSLTLNVGTPPSPSSEKASKGSEDLPAKKTDFRSMLQSPTTLLDNAPLYASDSATPVRNAPDESRGENKSDLYHASKPRNIGLAGATEPRSILQSPPNKLGHAALQSIEFTPAKPGMRYTPQAEAGRKGMFGKVKIVIPGTPSSTTSESQTPINGKPEERSDLQSPPCSFVTKPISYEMLRATMESQKEKKRAEALLEQRIKQKKDSKTPPIKIRKPEQSEEDWRSSLQSPTCNFGLAMPMPNLGTPKDESYVIKSVASSLGSAPQPMFDMEED